MAFPVKLAQISTYCAPKNWLSTWSLQAIWFLVLTSKNRQKTCWLNEMLSGSRQFQCWEGAKSADFDQNSRRPKSVPGVVETSSFLLSLKNQNTLNELGHRGPFCHYSVIELSKTKINTGKTFFLIEKLEICFFLEPLPYGSNTKCF